jgi:hypothetical protein
MSYTFADTGDNVYYDVTITNIETIDQNPPSLYFNETRNTPFIYDPESYYLSIIRFTLDTPTLPVFIPVIQPNQSDRDLTIYSVTLSWTNPVAPFQVFNQQTFIQYAPQLLGQSIIVPAPPSQTDDGLQNNNTGYYEIINYQYWIQLINNAFTDCYNDLATQVTTAGLALPSTHAPSLAWDTTTDTAILTAEQVGYSPTGVAPYNPIEIYMNPALYQLFSSFPVIIKGSVGIANGKNCQLIMDGFGGANVVKFPPTAPAGSQYDALQIVQEYSTIALWTPITSIVFTSNTLPVVPANISSPLLFLNGAVYNNGGNNANISQIITDFVSDTGVYKPNIVYTPSAQYRLINLVGNTPIYNLDLNVYWKSRTGKLFPFKLSSGSTATIKMLFTRKGMGGSTS